MALSLFTTAGHVQAPYLNPRFNSLIVDGQITSGALTGINWNAFKPSAPAGTTSATLVMMGVGSTAKYTPSKSGNLLVYYYATMTNNGTSPNNTCVMQANYGTGTPPVNGAAPAGQSAGTMFAGPGVAIPAAGWIGSLLMVLTAQTLGTQLWFDLSADALAGGTTSLANIDIIVVEF